MYEISLFPLNTVLFPGIPIQLHIFEERYLKMIHRCLRENQPFGVVLIHQGVESNGPLAEPVSVGCAARIFQTSFLEDGRIDLWALGDERFQILSLNRELPYLTGQVELLPLEHPHSIEMMRGIRRLTQLIKTYLQTVHQLDSRDFFDSPQLHFPEDPGLMLSLAAALLQVPMIEKQMLLEMSRGDELLHELLRLYRRDLLLFRQKFLVGNQISERTAGLN